jgi:hypothetical protein
MFDLTAANAAGDAHAQKEAGLLRYLIVWEGTHRTLIYGVIALSLWVAAYLIYWKNDLINWQKHRKPHRWGVDLANKSVTSGRKGLQ